MNRPTDNAPLTSKNILRDFGDRSAVARECVSALFGALGADDAGAVAPWSAWFGRWAGRALDKIPLPLARLGARYGVADDPTRLLFALQSYYALLVRLLAERFSHGQGRIDDSLPGNPFDWCKSARSRAVGHAVERLTVACEGYSLGDCPDFWLGKNGTVPLGTAAMNDDGECDLFKPLYQNLFPRALRHLLGEYYTPDWLADHVLDQVGYHGQPDARLLDPACGSGTFLLLALRRMVGRSRLPSGTCEKAEGERSKAEKTNANCILQNENCKLAKSSPQTPVFPLPLPQLASALSRPADGTYFPTIVGFDLNPLAVLTARANWAITIARLLPEHEPTAAPIYLYDSILGRGEAHGTDAASFDFVVGNPPWIAWDNLADEDRRATKPLWERYGLFSLTGNEARHGGGKKDLSMLMLYAATDRYLRPAGRLGMVVSQSLFQTKGAGDGFRRFRLGDDGPPLHVLRVDDMVALRPFDDAATRTSVIVLEKGAETEYPVAYYRWNKGEGGRGKAEELARPIDPARLTSPWLVEDMESVRDVKSAKSDYTAHLGANSGGANGVYWVERLGPFLNVGWDKLAQSHQITGEKPWWDCASLSHPTSLPSPACGRGAGGEGVLIRNLASRGKHSVETIEAVIEPGLLHPLLRWGDIGRFSARPKAFLILTQDPATRQGIDESVMRAKYPQTLAYFERFRELLERRAAYRRYQQGGPFYAMYNVGPYTVAPIKVVWRRMDRRINAAVVEGAAIPQETCVLVACDSSDEAHYLCAMLNSAAVNRRVAAHSMAGAKSFGTPGMFDYLPLRRFQPGDARHAELSQLSRQAHVCGESAPMAELQERIDELAEKVWGESYSSRST